MALAGAASTLASGRSATHRIDRLRVRHLRLLELVVTMGSLTAAAEALHISQPSTTKMLQELEHAFGCVLVDRSARGGTLSIAGARALERLRIATGALDAAGQALAEEPHTALVRIGMLPLAGVALIPRMVAELSTSGQLPRLRLIEGTVALLLDRLRNGEIDCVIGRVDADNASRHGNEFDIAPLSDEGYEVACAPQHPLARARKLGLARLRVQAWAVAVRGTYTRQVFETAFASQGLPPPQPHIECSAFHTNLATVASSHLLTLAPRSAVLSYVALGRVRKLDLAHPFQPDFLVFITLRNSVKLPAAQLVADTLKKLAV